MGLPFTHCEIMHKLNLNYDFEINILHRGWEIDWLMLSLFNVKLYVSDCGIANALDLQSSNPIHLAHSKQQGVQPS